MHPLCVILAHDVNFKRRIVVGLLNSFTVCV